MKFTNQIGAKEWLDETGAVKIPANRITKSEKLKERVTTKLAKASVDLNTRLTALKEDFNALAIEVYEAVLAENAVNPEDRKGNFTFYNFDRSIKIEVNIQESIRFDDMLIQAAKTKLDEFLESNMGGLDDMIRNLVLHAFETRKGQLDTKRVMNLLSYRSRVDERKYPAFHEAMKLVEKSIYRPKSKTYYRIFLRDASGEYQNIELNFSTINIQHDDQDQTATASRF